MAQPITTLGFDLGQNLSPELFDPAELAAAETLLQQYIVDNVPSLVSGSNATLFDINIRPRAIIYMLSRAEWTALRATQSLQGVQENPELASDAIVDAILSNNLITRRLGSKATGRVRVQVTKGGTYTVSSNVTFTAPDGLIFNPQANYRAIANPQSDTDLKLVQADDSGTLFYFLVPVVAQANGLQYQEPTGTSFTLSQPPSNFILADAFGNFQGGTNDETNDELIARIPEALSVRNMVSPLAISSVLKTQFPEILDLSVQRMNDPAMTRNAHNLMSVKQGGYTDIYVRTAAAANIGTVDKTATLIDIDDDNNATYRVQLTRDDFPGHYFVVGILEDSTSAVGSYSIIQETKNFENRVDANDQATGTQRPNSITTVQEAAYSRFQTNTVLFKIEYDPTLGTTPVDQFTQTISVTVQARYLPLIKDIQQFVSDNQKRVALADYLVRAVIPCMVQFSTITVEAAFGTDISAIRQAVYTYVNSIKIGDRLRIDEVISAIKKVMGVKYVQLPIRVVGQIYGPSGTVFNVAAESALTIPVMPPEQVLPETCAFFVDLPDIPVSLIES